MIRSAESSGKLLEALWAMDQNAMAEGTDRASLFCVSVQIQFFCTHVSEKKSREDKKICVYFALCGWKVKNWAKSRMILAQNRIGKQVWIL